MQILHGTVVLQLLHALKPGLSDSVESQCACAHARSIVGRARVEARTIDNSAVELEITHAMD